MKTLLFATTIVFLDVIAPCGFRSCGRHIEDEVEPQTERNEQVLEAPQGTSEDSVTLAE